MKIINSIIQVTTIIRCREVILSDLIDEFINFLRATGFSTCPQDIRDEIKEQLVEREKLENATSSSKV